MLLLLLKKKTALNPRYCLFLSWARAPESQFKVKCENCYCISEQEARSVVHVWTFDYFFICTLCLFLLFQEVPIFYRKEQYDLWYVWNQENPQ